MPMNYIRHIIDLTEEATAADLSCSEEIQRAFNRAMEEYLIFGTVTMKISVPTKAKKIKRNLPDWF